MSSKPVWATSWDGFKHQQKSLPFIYLTCKGIRLEMKHCVETTKTKQWHTFLV